MATPLDWMTDPNLCGRTFGGPTWAAGRALVAAIFGLPMTPEMLSVYRECTGRGVAPIKAFARATVIAGRGAGKTLLAAFVVVFLACSRNFKSILGPGELATVMLLCPDRRQARVAFRYVRGLLAQSPMLERLIVSETKESITLSTGAVIEIHTSSFRSTRGYSLAGTVIDEAGFLPTDDSANPDIELERALQPGRARVPGSLGLIITSPYAKRGLAYQDMQRYHGDDSAPVLTWRAPTRRMNPTIAQAVVDEALREDEASARAEWLAEFREDIASYLDIDTIRRVVIPGRTELPPAAGLTYSAFCDPAAGTGRDSFTLAIGHRHASRLIVDKLVEITPPFSPAAAVGELAEVLQAYRCRYVTHDRFGGAWVIEAFKAAKIVSREAEHTRSELYLEALPIFTAGPSRCELPDHPKMVRQFSMLERRTGRSGKDAVDHPARGGGPSGAHDDLSNSVAGLLVQLAARRGPTPASQARTEDMRAQFQKFIAVSCPGW